MVYCLIKYDLNQLRTVPPNPSVLCSLVTKIVWSMVSKAADKSKSTTTDTFLSPAESKRSLVIKLIKTVSLL